MYRTFGLLNICFRKSVLISDSDAALVTIKLVAVEIMSAGIWLTRPSPIVRMVYVDNASVNVSPLESIPIISPPIIFRTVMIMPIMASLFTYLLAPSIAP